MWNLKWLGWEHILFKTSEQTQYYIAVLSSDENEIVLQSSTCVRQLQQALLCSEATRAF